MHKVEGKGREFEKQNVWENYDTLKEFISQISKDGLTRGARIAVFHFRNACVIS